MRESEDEDDKFDHCVLGCILICGKLSQNIRYAVNQLKTSYLTQSEKQFVFKHNSRFGAVFSPSFKRKPQYLLKLVNGKHWQVWSRQESARRKLSVF